jgi:hypothetical protein
MLLGFKPSASEVKVIFCKIRIINISGFASGVLKSILVNLRGFQSGQIIVHARLNDYYEALPNGVPGGLFLIAAARVA